MESRAPYSLLRPVRVPKPAPGPDCVVRMDDLDIVELIECICCSPAWSYDYETRGTETWKPETKAVGLALAWVEVGGGIGYIYVDDSDGDGGRLANLLGQLWASRAAYSTVCAYNSYFDSAITRMHLRRRGEWVRGGLSGGAHSASTLQVTRDCYLLHRLLASEGWPGQSWSLKYAMVQLLGWPDTNEAGIDEWLLSRGHHTSGPARNDGEAPEAHLARLADWVAVNPDIRRVSPDKSRMHLVPAAILGPYACLDAVATLQLWLEVLEPVCRAHPLVTEWHDEYSRLTSLLIDQQYRGIRLDYEGMKGRGRECAETIARAESDASSRAEVRDVLGKWHEARMAPYYETEPEKWKKRKLGAEPGQYTKRGEVSRSWLQWCARRDAEPEPTKTWPAWAARVARAATEEKFKWSSGDQLRWLLFGSANSKWPAVEWHGLLPFEWGDEPDLRKGRRGSIWVDGRFGRVELERTKQGGLPVDDVVLNQLGDGLREHILEAATARKELQYVEAYLDLAYDHGGGEWRLHPGWTIHGAKTGRLAGKNPSIHQSPKVVEFLRHLVADPGMAWVEIDFTALEPYTLAGLSRDAGLMDLYGPGANPHDRYLYSVSKYPGALGDAVRRVYPSDWTDVGASAKAVGEAKKKCKVERQIGKVLVLSGDYGAGWRKQLRTLNASGVRISAEDMKRLNEAHRELHSGVYVEYAGRLEAEWHARGGWFLSALGLPTPVYSDRVKDLVNRQVQRTGHDYLILLIGLVNTRLIESDIPHDGVCWDLHDQLIIQLPAERAAEACTLIAECVIELNAGLAIIPRLKGDPNVATNMAQAKMAEDYAKWELERDTQIRKPN